MIVIALPDGQHRILGFDPANQKPDVPLTMEQLRATSVRITGSDFGMRDPVWLTRFGNATKVADRLRCGRVLLAGDAAHMHWPTGGIGLNLGIQDAVDLGWKLAAEVQNRAAEGLLDTYSTDRRPVGAAAGAYTLAQTALITATTPAGQALRALTNDLLATEPAVAKRIAAKTTAVDVAYQQPDPDAHHLAGTRTPFSGVDDALFPALSHGRPVLLSLSDTELPSAAAVARSLGFMRDSSKLAGSGRSAWSEVKAAIVRPDGYVWWATNEVSDLDTTVARALHALGTTF